MWFRRFGFCVKFCSSFSPKSRKISTLRGPQVEEILREVRERDGLCEFTPHVEYLVGSNREAFTSTSGTGGSLDISDKTQLILQSAHPVRHVIEREIRAISAKDNLELKYLDWITLFGRSLVPSNLKEKLTATDLKLHEDKLGKVGTASECGMFSAEVHQTVINIPANFPAGSLHSEFNLGNKYAVLVGDYFAIKTIYFAEKVKSSHVFLEIIHGVEEYTCSSFTSNSNLLDPEIPYPILPHRNAKKEDWINYSGKFMGYFTGGLNAAFLLNAMRNNDLNPRSLTQVTKDEDLQSFVISLALILKLVVELNELESQNNQQNYDSTNFSLSLQHQSTRFFTSLPAILYQEKERDIFRDFRNLDYEFDPGLVEKVRHKIVTSSAIQESREMLRHFSAEALQSFNKSLGKDEYYSKTLNKLLNLCT